MKFKQICFLDKSSGRYAEIAVYDAERIFGFMITKATDRENCPPPLSDFALSFEMGDRSYYLEGQDNF